MAQSAVFFLLVAICLQFMTSATSQGAEDGPIAGKARRPSSAAQSLRLVSPEKSELNAPVQVEFALKDGSLIADFTVHTPSINAQKVLEPGQYPFQFDVVEVFISVNGAASPFPYFELELSPYDQSFNVKILSLKKPFQNGVELGLEHEAEILPDGSWTAHLAIPLAKLGWQGDAAKIVGNAFAVLGKGTERSYWSLFLPQQKKPNFHQPRYFQKLL
jgi:hypothetical protein